MKLFIYLNLIILPLLLTSCASNKYHVEELSDYSYKHFEEIQEHVFKIVDNHQEYSTEQKTELKKVLKESLDKNRDLKIKENKYIQLVFDSYLVNKKDMDKIGEYKSKMTDIYEKKEELFLETANKIKSIIGTKETNHVLTMEISPFMQ